MSEQSPSVFPPRRRSHLKSETVRTLARILTLFREESQSLPAIQISLEAPKLGTRDGKSGLGTQQKLCNDLVDPGGLKPDNFSIESTKAVGIHNASSNSERIVINQLDDRTRPEGHEYLGCREISAPFNMSMEKDLIVNGDVASINDHSEHLVSEQIAVKKSSKVGGIMEDRGNLILSSKNAAVTGFPEGTSELEQIVTKESESGTRLEGNEDIACGNDVHSRSYKRMEKDLVADIVVASSDNHFNICPLEQSDVVETSNVAGKVEYKANFDLSIQSSEEFGVQDGAPTPEQRVTVEFGHRMGLKGNGDLTFDDIKDTCISLAKDQVANEVGASINNHNNDVLCSEWVDVEVIPQVPEALESELLNSKSMLENDLIPEESTSVNNAKDGASLAHMMKELEHELQWKELDLKESASDKLIPEFSVSFGSNREIEDGEILDDSGVSSHLIDSSSEDAVLETKGAESQIFGDTMKKEKFSDKCKEHKGENEDCVQAEFSGKYIKGKEARSRTLVRNEKEEVNDPKGYINCPIAPLEGTQLHEEISDKIVTQTFPMTSKEKDVKVCDKKKRGSSSENRKMKKKLQKKRKRAKENKLLGVKRLKLHPVLKPKPVTYCTHYLRGRCWQGDSCKYSHDTIPLTKSTPCKHFARNLCLKGDDCPFDHELSKYPCDNYMSKGSCIRGDKCLFSHKILPKEPFSPSVNAGKSKLESSALLDNSNSRKEVNVDSGSSYTVDDLTKDTAVRVPFSTGTIPRSTPEQNVVGKRLKPLGQVPRGIRFLVNGNTPLDDSYKKQHGDLLSNGDNGMEMCNQKSKSAPDKPQNLSEIQWRAPPAVPPKGISFLSMGKLPLSDPSKQQVGGLLPKQDGVEICNGKNQTSHKLQNLNETALRMSETPFSIGHSMTTLTDGNEKSVQSSSQKALSSTLAFAAKYDSEIGLGHSTCPPAFCAEVSKASRNNSYFSTENSRNDPMKASKIMKEFLFGVGGNGNQ
ncbi:hypothetical protein NE237_027299 [Protea cynaroides]|uniref:C3H1-type domain-containing protein n=1 Tax=Protea cynaroides TaxID=273540 RepID=A0A9Q0GMA1_9MAGN|nr:hypothetical protein NE237_027299 [Protea cynaroides]